MNFMMEEGQERVKASFRDNYDRLATIKKKYDPNKLLPREPEHSPGIKTDGTTIGRYAVNC